MKVVQVSSYFMITKRGLQRLAACGMPATEYTENLVTPMRHLPPGPTSPVLGMLSSLQVRRVIVEVQAATTMTTMSRQDPADAVSVSSSPRSSTITNLGLADDLHQQLEPSSGLDARPGQSYTPSREPSEIEMHMMDHTPSGIEIPTSNHGNGRTTPTDGESLISPVQHDLPTEGPTGVEIVEIARTPWVKRLGKMAIAVLILGTAVILGAVSFTGFLWFAGYNNRIWHAIIVRDWLTKSVTILGEAIKQAVNFQIGIGGAMLAALALERGEVLLGGAASLSMMRNGLGSGKLLSLSKKQLRDRKTVKGSSFTIPCFILVETKILVFVQAITIILTSDIGLQPTPGYPKSSETAIGFYNASPVEPQPGISTRVTTWSRKAAFYPTFAEYSELPFIADGVSDTGLTLRAFLPYSSAQDRGDTYMYDGPTTVLDCRVTCQLPNLEGEAVYTASDYSLYFTGSVNATRTTPRLVTLGNNLSVPFFCIAPSNSATYPTNQWRATLCQLGEGWPEMVSEFKSNLTIPELDAITLARTYYGTAYLMVNLGGCHRTFELWFGRKTTPI